MLTGQPGEPSNVTFGLSPSSTLLRYTSILIFRRRAGNEPIALMRLGDHLNRARRCDAK